MPTIKLSINIFIAGQSPQYICMLFLCQIIQITIKTDNKRENMFDKSTTINNKKKKNIHPTSDLYKIIKKKQKDF